MLLRALVELGSRMEASGQLLPRFYAERRLGYRLNLDAKGRPLGPIEVITDPANPKRGLQVPIPATSSKTSGNDPTPIDKSEYVLGIAVPGKEQRAVERHDNYVNLVSQIATDTDDPSAKALFRFLSDHLGEVELPSDPDPAAYVAVYVSGSALSESPALQRWWAERRQDSVPSTSSGVARRCSVCRREVGIPETIDVSIQGLEVIGGKPTMGLVTGNSDVFEHHGMKRAAGASICTTCGERSHQALNFLLRDPAHNRVLGDTKLVWWTSESIGDLLGALIAGDSDESVGPFLDAFRRGGTMAAPQTGRFYSATLGANVNRVVVRDWIDASLGDVVDHVTSWLEAVEIIDWDGVTKRLPGLYSLLAGLAPPGSGTALSRISPVLVEQTLRSVLVGGQPPEPLLSQCLSRIRALQGDVHINRAALLKAYLITHDMKEGAMTALDTESSDVAYRCGRLLALLDSAARAATNTRTDLVDRSYAAASTMPASTFPRLLKLHRAHLNKLRRDHPGTAQRVQAEAEEVLGGISDLPSLFTPPQQARFALGLYHQQAAERARWTAAKVAKSQADDLIAPIDATEEDHTR
jgi:CRISPR-associated protein Csd1